MLLVALDDAVVSLTDLPMVGHETQVCALMVRRGFPTDLPMVGLLDGNGLVLL